jgi:hypothetical protein
VLQLYSDSGYSLDVLGERGGGIREDQILQFFPKHSFLFFYYHKMNLLYSFIISKILVYIFNLFWTNSWNSIEKGCHTNCVTFLAFWQHLCSLYFFLSYCYLCQCQAVYYYYMPEPTTYHWNISFQKNVHRNMLSKCQKCNTICVTTFFYWISRVCPK